MQFKDIIGQEEVSKHLAEMVYNNRLSHALLFLGKEGSGALSMALAFAQYVVCEKANGRQVPQVSSLFDGLPVTVTPKRELLNDSCGECPACLKAKQYVHPDIHFSYPVIPRKPGDKPVSTDYITEWREFIQQHPYGNVYDWLQSLDAENKQGNITAHECNDIIHKLSLKSFESEFKILIMWMPQYLGREGNKLLKLIEEPPPNTLFILVDENEELILPTIISRCQLVKIPQLSAKDIAQALVERSGIHAGQARQIAAISDGNYREALQQLQHTGSDWEESLREWLNCIVKKDMITQVKWIEEMSKTGREKQKQFLRYFNHLLEQSIRLRIMGNMENIADKELDFAERLNKLIEIPQQQAIIEELDRAAYYIERNANAKMLFHALTIKLFHIIRENAMIYTW
ncbi:MAG TPA: hypothetical protein VJ647_00365 [Chitinophagaceae bacterium]|nr:hypothetical protein [Chitinophagaceae bacterium]